MGTKVGVTHLAASGLGAKITATATIAEVRGKRILFDVTANQAAREIGKGKHTRAIVEAEQFMAKVKPADRPLVH